MVAGVEMPVESDRSGRPMTAPSLQVRLLGPMTICRDGVDAGAAGIAQGARALRLSGACAARRLEEPTLRTAVGCPQRSARRASLVPQQDQEHRRRAWPRTRPHPRGHHPARPAGLLRRCDRDRPRDSRRASRRSLRSGCERCPRCSTVTFSRAWKSTAARSSTAGSPRSGADSVAATPPCWNISSGAFPTMRCSGIWRSGSQLAPFDRRVHEILLNALARRGRIREGEEHLAATARLFEAEGLDVLRFATRGGQPGRKRRRAAARAPPSCRRCHGRRRGADASRSRLAAPPLR